MLGLPMVYHALGRPGDSDQALDAFIAKYEKDWAYNIACVYAFRREPDRAFAWLEKAIEYHDPGLSGILTNNLPRDLGSDPRWLPFLRKIAMAQEQLAQIKFNVTVPQSP